MSDDELALRLWEVLAPKESVTGPAAERLDVWWTTVVLDKDTDDECEVDSVCASRKALADIVTACWFAGTTEWKGLGLDPQSPRRGELLTQWKELLGPEFSALCDRLPDRLAFVLSVPTARAAQAVVAFDAAAGAWAEEAERHLRMYEPNAYDAVPGWGYRTNPAAVYIFTNSPMGAEGFWNPDSWFSQAVFQQQMATRKPREEKIPAPLPRAKTRVRKDPEPPADGQALGEGVASHTSRMLSHFPYTTPAPGIPGREKKARGGTPRPAEESAVVEEVYRSISFKKGEWRFEYPHGPLFYWGRRATFEGSPLMGDIGATIYSITGDGTRQTLYKSTAGSDPRSWPQVFTGDLSSDAATAEEAIKDRYPEAALAVRTWDVIEGFVLYKGQRAKFAGHSVRSDSNSRLFVIKNGQANLLVDAGTSEARRYRGADNNQSLHLRPDPRRSAGEALASAWNSTTIVSPTPNPELTKLIKSAVK
ncbi:hypothetical protein OHV05_37190 (plasmid) [Kitasatospora sp. NBC_00070]|uniref:hypothetical protein n=1 Tax=Kitasatospora sp. NBC_00070 TaxID=2975962 RepID=UPI002F9101F6